MDENKEALKKDLQIILRLNSKINYTNVDAVKKIYTAITEKDIFHSELGQRYTKKLERIIAGEDDNTCILCSKDSTVGKVICNACLDKISTQKARKKEDTVSTIKNVTASVMSKENLDKTKETAQKALNKADEKLQSFNEKTDASNKFATAITHLKSFWSKRSKRTKVIIVCILALLLLGIFVGGGNDDDMLSYLGTSQEQVFKDYDKNQFYKELNLLTNEGTDTNGKAYITINSGKVTGIMLDSGMYSSLNIAGIHIGDSANDIEKQMNKYNASHDSNSISGKLEIYHFKFDGKSVQVTFKLSGGIIEHINCSYNG